MPMVQRSVVAGIEGRLGHLAYDPASGCLYVACKAAGSVEVMDNTQMKTLQSVKDLPEPRGMAFSPTLRRLFVTCGDGTVRVFDVDKQGLLTQAAKVDFRGEANPIRIDPKTNRVHVGFGKFYSSFDGKSGEKGKEIELPGFADSILLEDAGPRVFVSIPKLGQIVVIDSNQNKIVETWAIKDAKDSVALTADQPDERLFVATRTPPQLVVLDMKTGNQVSKVDIANDADDAWYDAQGKRVYVSCGGSKTAMVLQKGKDEYTLEHMEDTNAGAMTSLLIPDKRKLIVASPKVGPDGFTFLYIYVLPP